MRASVEVRRSVDRGRTDVDGRSTAHSFSFGGHYEPDNVAFGPLVAHNDERLAPGTGYAPHRHADVDIVSWVIDGALRHEDERGHRTLVRAGGAQRLSAGAGAVHSEECGSDVPTRFLQSWLRPDVEGGEPAYASRVVEPEPDGWVVLAGEGGLSLRTAAASLLLGMPAAEELVVPSAPRRHVFVANGEVVIAGEVLGDGDAVRTTGAGDLSVAAVSGTPQVLAWLLP